MTGGFRTRRVLGAPFAAATYLRAVHLLLGGVFMIPYVLLVQAFSAVSVGLGATDTPLLVALVALAGVIGIGVTLVPAIRSVEIVMARTLLGVELPDPESDQTRSWTVRLRSAAWYAISLPSCRQAEAAARVLDTDPQFVRGALDAVAEVSRRALDDLDRVMDLLRRDEMSGPDTDDATGDLGTLADLLDTVRAGGYEGSDPLDLDQQEIS